MATVKLMTKKNEYENINYYREFEILDEYKTKYLMDDIIDYPNLYEWEKINLDVEEKNEIIATHRFYRIREDGGNRYIAVPNYIDYRVTHYPGNWEIVLETFEGTEGLNIMTDALSDMIDNLEKREYIEESLLNRFGFIDEDMRDNIIISMLY